MGSGIPGIKELKTMLKKGEPMSKWLQTIEDDQNVQGIGNLDDTTRNDAGRHFFVRQDIAPAYATYDPITGRLNQGGTPLPTTRTAVSSALNTPTLTLTCAANRAYKVIFAGGDNNTTAASWRVVYTPFGGTAAQLLDSGTGTTAVNVTTSLIGGSSNPSTVSNIGSSAVAGFWMRAGDTLNIENTNDQVGDTITIAIVYEEYIAG